MGSGRGFTKLLDYFVLREHDKQDSYLPTFLVELQIIVLLQSDLAKSNRASTGFRFRNSQVTRIDGLDSAPVARNSKLSIFTVVYYLFGHW